MSASSNSRATIARALLLNPARVTGPQQPDRPSYLRILLAGGEWVDWDVRRDLAVRIPEFLEGPQLSRRTQQSLNAVLDAINIQRLRTAEAALAVDAESTKIPLWRQVACQELAKVLVLVRAECGDAQACATAAGYAIAEARASIVRGDLGSWFHIRAALWWAYRGKADTFDIEYKPAPRYADLVSEDELLKPLAELLADARAAQIMIEVEEDILRGGAGAQGGSDLPPEFPADWDPSDLGDQPVASPVAGPALVVFPNLRHLPEPTKSARDRGDSPRALVEDIAEKPLPLVHTPDPAAFRQAFLAACPWAEEAAEVFAMDLVGAPFAWFRPRILVGPPGEGKTASARLLVQLAGLDCTVYSAAGQMDGGSFAGTSRQWGSWRLSVPAQAILRARKASVGIVVDEVEKAGPSRRWGRLDETVLPFLERHTARAIFDPSLEANVNLSAVSFILTANSLDGLSAPMRDRCQVLRWQGPRREHLPFVAQAIVREIRTDRGLDASWIPDLDGDELDALDWWRGGSLRPLRRAVETILAARDVYTARH